MDEAQVIQLRADEAAGTRPVSPARSRHRSTAARRAAAIAAQHNSEPPEDRTPDEAPPAPSAPSAPSAHAEPSA